MSLAIIGFGPRGLHSLERYMYHAENQGVSSELEILVFNDSKNLGTGSAWNLDQADSNLINIDDKSLRDIPERKAITIAKVVIPEFDSFSTWSKGKVEQDAHKYIFFSRNILGEYLNQRSNSITKVLEDAGYLKVVHERVTNCVWSSENDHFQITTDRENTFHSRKILLTIGHLKTKLSDEQQININFAKNNNLTYLHNPYSGELSDNAIVDKNVAIIGYGLTFIDIARLLTVNLGGEFKPRDYDYLLDYIPSGKEPNMIVPYSFDGLPAVPKPYGLKQDEIYKPSEECKSKFETEIKQKLKQPEDFSVYDLLACFADVVVATINAEDYNSSAQELKYLTISWLTAPEIKHSQFLDATLPTREYMLKTVAMAMGEDRPTLDFAFGQIWRHIQPILYRLFAFTDIKPSVMNQIINVDECTKRYSYGPPVASILQMVALIDANVMTSQFLKDPDIERNSNGWKFSLNDSEIVCETLINSVLSSPDLMLINDELISNLKQNKAVKQYYKGLGVKVNAFSRAESDKNWPLYVIGRKTKGSILGADAILECFSPEIDAWAKRLF